MRSEPTRPPRRSASACALRSAPARHQTRSDRQAGPSEAEARIPTRSRQVAPSPPPSRDCAGPTCPRAPGSRRAGPRRAELGGCSRRLRRRPVGGSARHEMRGDRRADDDHQPERQRCGGSDVEHQQRPAQRADGERDQSQRPRNTPGSAQPPPRSVSAPVIVIVSTTVTRSGTLRYRMAASWAPIDIASSATIAWRAPAGNVGPVRTARSVPAPPSQSLTTSTLRQRAAPMRPGRPVRPGADQDADDESGQLPAPAYPRQNPYAPAKPKPMNTRLPVIVATNTCPRRRMLTASTTPRARSMPIAMPATDRVARRLRHASAPDQPAQNACSS